MSPEFSLNLGNTPQPRERVEMTFDQRIEFANVLSKTVNVALESQSKRIFWNPTVIDPFRCKVNDDLKTEEYYKRIGVEVKKMEDNGVEMLNNFELMAKKYLFYLAQLNRIAMPYTETPVLEKREKAKDKTKKMLENIGKRSDGLPVLIVKKPNGLFGSKSHGGEGIEILDPNKTDFKWNDNDLIFQEFIYPPLDIFKDGYMRDARIILIDGEPKVWYMRRAKDRLINPITKKLDENLPSRSRFLSNLCQEGTYEEPPKELKKKSFQFAREIYQEILDWGNLYRKVTWQIGGEAKCRFLAVDLLYDQNGNPKLLEVDTYPNMNLFPKGEVLAEKMASYLKELSGKTGKSILINNLFCDNKLANETTRILVNKNIKCEQMIFPPEVLEMLGRR